jgi:sortase A
MQIWQDHPRLARRTARKQSALAHWLEGLSWTAGAICLTVWAAATAAGSFSAREDVRAFEAMRAATTAQAAEIDTSLWSEPRVRAWRATLGDPQRATLGVLRVARLRIEAPVLEGTDDWTLNRGVGHIADTATPGASGNIGIAGHRDGFFRALKDIAVGDVVELDTLHETIPYRVERVWIVEPDDVSVLDPTTTPAVTLVTCYPFYFVGSAPQRYIVRAVRTSGSGHF